MKNILVPTDFSPCSKNAAFVAFELAKRFGAKLHLFHSQETQYAEAGKNEKGEPQPGSLQEVVQRAEAFLAQVWHFNVEVPVETAYGVGKPWEGIDQYVTDHGIDLIVMGSHGTSGKNQFFIGSNTQRVVRRVHCPVLVIKNPLENVNFQKVVFACRFQENELAAFVHFIDFIKHFIPEIHLVSIRTSPLDAAYPILLDAMKPFVDACHPLACEPHVFSDLSVDEGVRTFANEIGAELIAISNQERHPLKRMFVGSNVEMLVNHADLPVLTIDFA